MSLRLTTGFCHGMRLEEPSRATRPTAARVRSAAWNSLQEEVKGARVLDVFAGSGAVGIEALSRGASKAVFVEKDKAALKALQQNLAEVRRRASAEGLKLDLHCIAHSAQAALPRLEANSFDIIWMDPPFSELPLILPELRSELARIGADRSWLVVESDEASLVLVASLFAADQQPWQLVKQKVYGKIGLSFFQKQYSSIEVSP